MGNRKRNKTKQTAVYKVEYRYDGHGDTGMQFEHVVVATDVEDALNVARLVAAELEHAITAFSSCEQLHGYVEMRA